MKTFRIDEIIKKLKYNVAISVLERMEIASYLDSAYNLAMTILQSDAYKDPETKRLVDEILMLNDRR
jgi:hypothetical protein